MELSPGIKIIEPYPAVYIERLDAVVIADVHLGMESNLADNGVLLPKVQLERLQGMLDDIFEQTEAKRLIIDGDLKHEFSHNTAGEREEVAAFIEAVREHVSQVTIIKGNHDNYLHYLVRTFDDVSLEPYVVEDGMCFVHGHRPLSEYDELPIEEVETVIIGHEHPAIALTDDVGVTEKIACFLYGTTTNGYELIVLPAFSSLASGTPMNRIKNVSREVLSPLLREDIEIGTMRVIGIDPEAGLFMFPALKNL